jgi:hypothetical protein
VVLGFLANWSTHHGKSLDKNRTPRAMHTNQEVKPENNKDQHVEFHYPFLLYCELVCLLSFIETRYSFGFESSRRYNLQYVDDDKLMYAAGNTVLLLNLKTLAQKCITFGFGVSAIAVS